MAKKSVTAETKTVQTTTFEVESKPDKDETDDWTVDQWVTEGVKKICDEHHLASLNAWRDPAGKTQVEFVPDFRAMHALRKK